MLALAARGWPLGGLQADTALSAYLSHPDQRSYDLADLTLRYLHRELKGSEPATDQLSFDLDGDSAESKDSMRKAHAVVDLAAALETELESAGRLEAPRRRRAPARRRAGPVWSSSASPSTSTI